MKRVFVLGVMMMLATSVAFAGTITITGSDAVATHELTAVRGTGTAAPEDVIEWTPTSHGISSPHTWDWTGYAITGGTFAGLAGDAPNQAGAPASTTLADLGTITWVQTAGNTGSWTWWWVDVDFTEADTPTAGMDGTEGPIFLRVAHGSTTRWWDMCIAEFASKSSLEAKTNLNGNANIGWQIESDPSAQTVIVRSSTDGSTFTTAGTWSWSALPAFGALPGTTGLEVEGYSGGGYGWSARFLSLYEWVSPSITGNVVYGPPSGAEGEGEGEAEGEGESEGEGEAPPVTNGAPVAGMMGLGLVAAACALGGATVLRKKK